MNDKEIISRAREQNESPSLISLPKGFYQEQEELTGKDAELSRSVKQLYDQREKIIVEKAVNAAKQEQALVNKSNMLEHEKHLFSSLKQVLETTKEQLLHSTIHEKEESKNE